MSWKTALSFIAFVTLLILLTGWLTINRILPVETSLNYSTDESNFIQFWLKLAVLIGIVLPGVALLIFWRNCDPRKILGFYLLVLVIQIVTEAVFSRVLFPSIVVTIGTFYTAFRIWQLWQGQQIMATTAELGTGSRTLLRALLGLMLIFWSSNLIMLFTLPWQKILSGNL
ncbi:hypothetical protein [Iningainema tapete]|uniref:hypothetical protein n=1 Tax=Iningainema tapete TaxID=2806730 RepID=UPI00192DD985|nr:hypothetical protein [Iningainema tapete]